MFKRFPFLGRGVLAASISPLDGHANPRLAAPAFARAAARLGARIVENTKVVRVEKENLTEGDLVFFKIRKKVYQ